MNLPRNYHFTIKKKDGYYFAKCWVNGQSYMTSAKTEDEIFDMISDLFKTILDIKCSWYRRLIWKVFRV